MLGNKLVRWLLNYRSKRP